MSCKNQLGQKRAHTNLTQTLQNVVLKEVPEKTSHGGKKTKQSKSIGKRMVWTGRHMYKGVKHKCLSIE